MPSMFKHDAMVRINRLPPCINLQMKRQIPLSNDCPVEWKFLVSIEELSNKEVGPPPDMSVE